MTPRLRASVVCEADGQLLVVRLRDPVTGVTGIFPPGGGIEEGETAAEAAARETLEETGVVVGVDSSSELVVRYPFRWAGVDYDVTTHWFRAPPTEPNAPRAPLPPVVDAAYNLGAAWMPLDEAVDAMAIHPSIASAVRRLLTIR